MPRPSTAPTAPRTHTCAYRYAERFKGSYRRFADFAPFLIVNRASASAVAKHTVR